MPDAAGRRRELDSEPRPVEQVWYWLAAAGESLATAERARRAGRYDRDYARGARLFADVAELLAERGG